MTNQLLKHTNITYTPGSPGISARPGQPYVPGYTAYTNQTVCGYVTTGGTWQWIKDDEGVWQYVLVPTGGSVAYSEYKCSVQKVPTYYPPQPYIAPIAGVAPTAATVSYDYNLGWNSGARSQGFFAGDGYTSFKVSPSLVGAVAGLNYTDPDADYINIDYAFYLSGRIARIMESGAEKMYIGPYAEADVFKIDRRKGVVRYYINDVLQYTSATTSTGITFLDVSMYSGGDYLDSPAIAAYAYTGNGQTTGTAPDGKPYVLSPDAMNFQPMAMSAGAAAHGHANLVMQPMTMKSSPAVAVFRGAALAFEPMAMAGGSFVAGAVGSFITRADMTFAPMTISSNPYQGGTLRLLPLVAEGSNYVYGEAIMSFAPLSLDSRPAAMVPAYALASLPMVGLTMSASCLTGEIGGVEQTMQPMTMLAGREGYAEARMSFAAPAMYAGAFEGNTLASMRELVISRTPISFYGFVEVHLMSHITASDEYLTLVLKDAAISESAGVDDTMSYSAIMQALMAINIQAFAGVPALSQDGAVWVVNDATNATTSYEGYNFNSFAKYQGRYLGARSDGVYLLGGDTDAGEPIRASISLGRQDFGTTALKAVANCYVGVSSSGDVYLKVLANDTSYLYKTARSDDYLRTQRVAVGRGLRATHMTFELYNEAGADFELASVEFEAAVLSRRI